MREPHFFAHVRRRKRQTAWVVATELEGSGVPRDILFSAAAYVISSGRRPTHQAVLDEARRRYAMLKRAVEKRGIQA